MVITDKIIIFTKPARVKDNNEVQIKTKQKTANGLLLNVCIIFSIPSMTVYIN